MTSFVSALSVVVLMSAGSGISAQTMGMQEKTGMVGGAPMLPSKDIIDNAVNSKDHTTLVAAVKAADLPGKLDAAALMAQAKANGGKAMLKTVSGGTLTMCFSRTA